METGDKLMKRKVGYYYAFGIAALLGAIGAVLAFVGDIVYLGVIAVIATVVCVFLLATEIARDNLNVRCGILCAEKRYDEERALIEKKMKSPFFFLVRIVAILRYVRASMALDDLPAAKRYIDRLRHNGGKGWKYVTAYYFILIKLDEGDMQTARTEYEEFRTQCAHAEIYREQIEVLTAIFHRLLKTKNAEPLPAAAVDSPFPVIGRILGRAYEERVAESETEWN